MNKFDKPYRILPTIDIRKGIELFNLAAQLDTHELLQYSLVNQVPLDFINSDGDCLIHEVINIDPKKASEHAKLNVIKFLVQNKVNPDQPNKNNQTPLHIACAQQLPLIIKYLLDLEVNPNYQDNMGNTPLHYLFTGLIKTVDTSTDVMDFIPPPKKQNVEINQKTIEIKKLLLDLIEQFVEKSDFIMLKTINETIRKIIQFDNDIVNRQLETQKSIIQIANKYSSEDSAEEIKKLILLNLKTIRDKIIKLFNGLPDLPNFGIHNKNETSWSPVPNSTFGLIADGNIKSVIKKNMKSIENDVSELIEDFQPINSISHNYYQNLFSEMTLDSIPNQNINISGSNYAVYKQYIPEELEDTWNTLRHPLALDNASDIINFKDLKYMGGPRNIIVEFDDAFNKFNEILNLKNDNQIILNSLGYDLSHISFLMITNDFNFIDNLKIFTNEGINIEGINISFFENIFDINKSIEKWKKLSTTLYLEFDDIQPFLTDLCFYLILAHTAILFREKFDQIQNINFEINDEYILDFKNNLFAKKWFYIFKTEPYLSSWLYSMFCDIFCKSSYNNLECKIPFETIMLVTGLSIYKNNITQSIINCYKPHIITYIVNNENNNEIKLAKILTTLLNDNFNKLFWNNIKEDSLGQNYRNIIKSWNVKSELEEFSELLYQWYNYLLDPKQLITKNNLYNKFENYGDTYSDVFIKIIFNLYQQMDNKLMKQTIVDLIYLFKNIDIKDNKLDETINNFKKLSTLELFQIFNYYYYKNDFKGFDKFNLDLSINYQPSYYSCLNYDIDYIIDDSNSLGSRHLIIAHLLGLYYEGTLNYTQYNFTDDYLLVEKNKKKYIFFPSYKSSNGERVHSLNVNNLQNEQFPLILNYLILDDNEFLTPKSKYFYYDIKDNNYIRIPTFVAYIQSLLSRINHYQILIFEKGKHIKKIVTNMILGQTKELSNLYIKLYPEIVSYANLLENYINSLNKITEKYRGDKYFNKIIESYKNYDINYDYKKLAKLLNNINSNYYLYYYLYQPGKMIKLSRFNYYQIPIEQPTKFFYYFGNSNLVNIMNEINPTQINGVEETLDHNDQSLFLRSNGFINDFKLGNYDYILDSYSKFILPTIGTTTPKDFVILKESKLPPSLYNALNDLYKFTLIEFVKKILKETNQNSEIYKKSEELIKNSNIEFIDYDLATYEFITKIIQELIKEKLIFFINNTVNDLHKKFITNNQNIIKLSPDVIIPTKEFKISLNKTSIIDKILFKKVTKNMYSSIIQPIKPSIEPFILYPNDLSNINRLKSKYGIIINPNIVKIMMAGRSSIYTNNFDGYSPIFPIIKNYNYKILQTLKNEENNKMIDFRNLNDLPAQYLIQENYNNLDKVLSNFNFDKDPIKNIFENIDGYLSNDVISLILSYDVFGKNILSYLSESFHVTTYLTLQYLSKSLSPQYHVNFNDSIINNILSLINKNSSYQIKIEDLNKNYLGENLKSLEIPTEIETLIAKHIIKEKEEDLARLLEELNQLKNKGYRMYNQLEESINKIIIEIDQFKKFINPNILDNIQNNDKEIIEGYESYNDNKDRISLMIKAWSQLFNQKINQNYNLIPLYILKEQKNLLSKINPNSCNDLAIIAYILEYWASIGEQYFSKKKYTENNDTLFFINNLLNYVTKIVIGNGIEFMMRRILLTWLQNSINADYEKINEIINFILEEKLIGKNNSLVDELYYVVCPKLVINSTEIFKNQSEEQSHYSLQTKEILINYFELLDLSMYKIPDEVKNIFRIQVVNYFDTFVARTIILWQVNVENILKYFINNYRCLQTLIEIIN